MNTYAAFLGHIPSLSLAELHATVPDMKVTKMLGTSMAFFETEAELNQKNLETWGGVFLLAKQVAPVGTKLNEVPAILADQVANVKGKVTFSLRTYNIPHQKVHDLYRDCKKALKKKEVPSRYIGNEKKPAATILLHETNIVGGKEGAEIVILGGDDYLWIGRTVAAQNPDAYTKRDMTKPVRDTRVGLLPPKLAQILLNFGEYMANDGREKKLKTLTVLDPFCGTGVIPMEALLRGWEVLASDNSLKAVNGCEKNLDWTRKEYGILKKDVASTVWKQDAQKPFELKEKPDVIVTETTLGTPFASTPPSKDAMKARTEVEEIETGFLENIAATLPGVPVVCTLPVWFPKAGPLYIEKTWKKIHDIGFRPILPPGVNPHHPERLSILYHRPDQSVGREIVLLKPIAK